MKLYTDFVKHLESTLARQIQRRLCLAGRHIEGDTMVVRGPSALGTYHYCSACGKTLHLTLDPLPSAVPAVEAVRREYPLPG